MSVRGEPVQSHAKRPVNRRHFLALATAAPLAGATLWLHGAPAPIDGLTDFAAVRAWTGRLLAAPHRSTTTWTVAHVLHHAAQSIEFSLDGYPQPRPRWFQATAGALAFAAFSRRGRMRHDTTQDLPGAPPVAGDDLPAAVGHLHAALARFETAHEFAAHFAYGPLDRDDYARAHLMHLAEHARQIVPA